MKKTTKILGQRVNTYSIDEVIQLIDLSIKKNKKSLFFALNINILVALNRSVHFKKIHERLGRVIFADGVPIIWLSKFTNNPIESRVSGTDLTEIILNNNKNKIYLLGSNKKILSIIKNKYPSVAGIYSPPHNQKWIIDEKEAILERIDRSKAKILLVALGPLKQEKWLIDNFNNTSCNVGIGVGSALDILSGEKQRAPEVLTSIGLEWLWRIFLEPKRLLKRYLSDFFYLIKIILNHLII
jgi:N-acetylglucosaminyldiphosphoundecaprenol N-acetyl-beta-D-mannosaminyltransferase